jgi:hypothetical protein
MVLAHLSDVRLTGVALHDASLTISIGAILNGKEQVVVKGVLSGTVLCWFWVTLPTIAWPPSLTDTCCTVPCGRL